MVERYIVQPALVCQDIGRPCCEVRDWLTTVMSKLTHPYENITSVREHRGRENLLRQSVIFRSTLFSKCLHFTCGTFSTNYVFTNNYWLFGATCLKPELVRKLSKMAERRVVFHNKSVELVVSVTLLQMNWLLVVYYVIYHFYSRT